MEKLGLDPKEHGKTSDKCNVAINPKQSGLMKVNIKSRLQRKKAKWANKFNRARFCGYLMTAKLNFTAVNGPVSRKQRPNEYQIQSHQV